MSIKTQTVKKFQEISPQNLVQLLKDHYSIIMPAFYETQTSFLSGAYKKYRNLDTANIVLCFKKNMNLAIIRQREKNLNFNVSLENFFHNFEKIDKPSEKIASLVKSTGIPKETVRRKIKKLLSKNFLSKHDESRSYQLKFLPKGKDAYVDHINRQIQILARFISKLTNFYNLNLSLDLIEKEIKSQFSFYWYHFLSCELSWLKMWQEKLKDSDLILIIIQATVPTLKYAQKNLGDTNLNDIFRVIGQADKSNFINSSIGASSVSDVTGIPRATCIRKLKKLVKLGFLIRDPKSKRYYINQDIEKKAKNVITQDTVNNTIDIFSNFLAIVMNSLILNQK